MRLPLDSAGISHYSKLTQQDPDLPSPLLASGWLVPRSFLEALFVDRITIVFGLATYCSAVRSPARIAPLETP